MSFRIIASCHPLYHPLYHPLQSIFIHDQFHRLSFSIIIHPFSVSLLAVAPSYLLFSSMIHVHSMLPLICRRAHWAVATRWHSGQPWASATWTFRVDCYCLQMIGKLGNVMIMWCKLGNVMIVINLNILGRCIFSLRMFCRCSQMFADVYRCLQMFTVKRTEIMPWILSNRTKAGINLIMQNFVL